MELESRLCLEAPSPDEPSLEAYVVLRPCNFLENARQTWRFQEYTDQYEDLLKGPRTGRCIPGSAMFVWRSRGSCTDVELHMPPKKVHLATEPRGTVSTPIPSKARPIHS